MRLGSNIFELTSTKITIFRIGIFFRILGKERSNKKNAFKQGSVDTESAVLTV